MAKPVANLRLQQDLIQIKNEYESLAGFQWLLFKVCSWRLSSALDDLDINDTDSVMHLYAAYENTWSPWLSSFFNLFTTITDSLFHQLLSHFSEDIRPVVISHHKADEFYGFSRHFGKIEEPAVLTPLLENEDLFEFIKTQFENKEYHLDALHQLVQLKLDQLPVLNRLTEMSGHPLSRWIDASVEQVFLFKTLLEQSYSSDEALALIEKIESLNTPQTQIDLIVLLSERPGLFLAHPDNLFKSIIDDPVQFTADIDFFRTLDLIFDKMCSLEQCQQIVNDNVLRFILNQVIASNEVDKAPLIQEIMAFPANKELLALMNRNHAKAMALVKFSIQFEGIRDKALIDLLIENDFLFDFVTRYFSTQTSKHMDALKHLVDLKLEHQKVWRQLAEKALLPMDSFYATNDEQQFLYESLLEETLELNEIKELVLTIQSLPSPKKQADLLKSYQAKPVLFYAHRENVFRAILMTQEIVSQDVELTVQLAEICSEDEWQLIIDDNVLKPIVKKIMTCSKTDKAALINIAMKCSDKQMLLELSTSYPVIDISQFLMLEEPAMKCIKRLEDGDSYSDLKSLLNSPAKAELFFCLLKTETKGSIIGPVVHKICQTNSAHALLSILMTLNNQGILYQSNVVSTFNVLVTFSQLDQWLDIVNSSRLNQYLVDTLCKSSPDLAECLLYLFQQYPQFQPHNDIAFLNEPNELKRLCITLKDSLIDSDVHLIIGNSTLRELLTILGAKANLQPGLVHTLAHHECAYGMLQVMKKYPLLDIGTLLKLERHHLNNIEAINGLESAEVTDLLQPEKFLLFNTLTQGTQLDNMAIKKIVHLNSEQARLIYQALSHLNDKPNITQENRTFIFTRLAAHQDLVLMCQLLELDVMTLLLNKPMDALLRLLDMKIRNKSLNGLLECLATKKVLTSENISEVIEASGTLSPIANFPILQILEHMSSQQLTQNNCLSVLRLCIATTWSDAALTSLMVEDLLNKVTNVELLRQIACHNHSTQMIKAFLAITCRVSHSGNDLASLLMNIQSTEDLDIIASHSNPEAIITIIKQLQLMEAGDDVLIHNLVTSQDLLDLFSILKQHEQMNPANIKSLMNSPQLLRSLLILNEQRQLNKTNSNMLLTSPNLLQAITIIEKHSQLNSNNLHALLDSSVLVTVCLSLEERALDDQIIDNLVKVTPANVAYIVPIIHCLDEMKVDWSEKKEVLLNILASGRIQQLAESIILLPKTPYNVLGVYSDIIHNGRSVSDVAVIIDLLAPISLPQEKTVDNFRRLINCHQLLSSQENINRLRVNVVKKDDKQKALEKFITELTAPASGFFGQFFSGSPKKESPNNQRSATPYAS